MSAKSRKSQVGRQGRPDVTSNLSGGTQFVPGELSAVKVTCRIEYETALPPFLGLRSLLRAAQGNDEAEIRGEPIVVTNEELFERVFLQVRGIVIEREFQTSTVNFLAAARETLLRLQSAVELPSPRLARLEVVWIHPFELPFSELASRVRERFLRSVPIVESATDVAVVLEETRSDSSKTTIQVGPMEPDQMNAQILHFKQATLPKQFLFVMSAVESRIVGPGAPGVLTFLEAAAGDSKTLASRAATVVMEATVG